MKKKADDRTDSPADYSTFQGICDWIEGEVLQEICNEYDPDFSTFGVAFISIEDGRPLVAVEPLPIIGEADVGDPEFQVVFAEQTRAMLKESGGTGIVMISNVQGEDESPDGVILVLEHKGGHAAWVSVVNDEGTLEPFERNDEVRWRPDHPFANLLPPRSLN